jgi:aspartate/methionine/tyrosine aminotransferase
MINYHLAYLFGPKIQESMKSKEFTDALLYNHNIFIAPGDIFGSNGEGYCAIFVMRTKRIIN